MTINTDLSGTHAAEARVHWLDDEDILPLPMYVTTVRPNVPAAEELKLQAAMDAVCRSLEIGVQP